MTGRTNAGGGVQLPALTNPAAAGNIQSGYQAINGEGEVVTGTYVPDTPEYGFLSAENISFDMSSRFEVTVVLPQPIKSLLGLNFAYRANNGQGDIDAIFTLPAGIYNAMPSETAMWYFITGDFGYLSISVSGNTVKGSISYNPGFVPSAYQFYCGAYRYIPQ